MSTKVRVTIEIDAEMVKLLAIKAKLCNWNNWLPSAPSGVQSQLPKLDAGSIIAWLVYMEARGARENEIHAATPMMWRQGEAISIIHEERRVYKDGRLVAGPELVPHTRMK